MGDLLKELAAYGFWDILSLLLVAGGAVWGYVRFFRAVRWIPNLTVFFHYHRGPTQAFPLVVAAELTNHTGKSMFITSVSFKCRRLRPDPTGKRDAGSGNLEIKFPPPPQNVPPGSPVMLSEFEAFLRDGESTHTWAPLDPTHSDEDVRYALQMGSVGYLECYVTLLSKDHKPFVYLLRAHPKIDYGIKMGPMTWLKFLP